MKEPHIDRPVRLQLQGDWGQANLHRICGWLAQEIGDRSGHGTRIATWTGTGGADAVSAVSSNTVDLALLVPAAFGPMAIAGTGLFDGSPHPDLRALGTIPQRDRLILAIDSELGIRTIAELRESDRPLRIATSFNDGINAIGFAVDTVLDAHGISRSVLEQRGCTFLLHERPHPCLAWLRDGLADAVIQEAIMTPAWKEAAEARSLHFIPLEVEAVREVEQISGLGPATVPAGYLSGLETELFTVDYSDFLLLCTTDLPDDVAEMVAWCMVNTATNLERQYRHLPADRSPITYPLEPAKVASTSIPLHPSAAACYEQLLPS